MRDDCLGGEKKKIQVAKEEARARLTPWINENSKERVTV